MSFDLFDTLVDLHMESLPRFVLDGVERRGTHLALHAQIARFAPVPFERFAATLAGVDRELRDEHSVQGRELPTLERFGELTRRLGIEAPELPLALTHVHMDAIREQVRPLAHHPGVLATLAPRLRLGVCSNFSYAPAARRVLDEHGLSAHLHAAVFSEQVGVRKPRVEMFEAIRAELDCAPGEILHVGDQLAADVAGATQLGLRTAWITRRVADPATARSRYRGPAPDHTITDLAELLPLLGS